jgi:hypothetical protein
MKLLIILTFITNTIAIQTYPKYVGESIDIKIGAFKGDVVSIMRIDGTVDYKNDWIASDRVLNGNRVITFTKTNLSREDSGKYKVSCVANENYRYTYFKLNISTVIVRLNSVDKTIIAGSNVTMDCLANENIRRNWKFIPYPNQKNDDSRRKKRTNTERETSIVSDKIMPNGTLKLINVDFRDSGKYVCKIRHGKSSYEDSTELIVIGNKITANYGDAIVVPCDSIGNDGNWIFQSFNDVNHRCYTSNHRDGRFSISNFTKNDEGIYNCNMLDPTNSITSVVSSSRR